jgi:OOP family OmpA-OmpF porin
MNSTVNREISLFICLFLFLTIGSAQEKRPMLTNSLTLGYNLLDFSSIQTLRMPGGLGAPDNKIGNFEQMFSGINVGYNRFLRESISFNIQVGASFMDTSLSNGNPTNRKLVYVEANSKLNWYLLRSGSTFNPYCHTGIGNTVFDGKNRINGQLGFGLQVTITRNIYIDLMTSYRKFVADKKLDHFFFSVSVGGLLSKRPLKSRNRKPDSYNFQISDKDSDGTRDSADSCPDITGSDLMHGCPDADLDGVRDSEDACPHVKGLPELKGCPARDTDGDGITDDSDSCQTTPGFERFHGCPIPDTDADGLNDELDSCIFTPGPATNHGCPVSSIPNLARLKELAGNIQFQSGEFRLSRKAGPLLDEIMIILKEFPAEKIQIHAYTDSIGSSIANIILSQKRAKSIRDYFVAKGFNQKQIITAGHGEDSPVASNHNEEGRRLNRRVEIVFERK